VQKHVLTLDGSQAGFALGTSEAAGIAHSTTLGASVAIVDRIITTWTLPLIPDTTLFDGTQFYIRPCTVRDRRTHDNDPALTLLLDFHAHDRHGRTPLEISRRPG